MERILRLVSTVNRNTYGFTVLTIPVHKFEFIVDLREKLRDARNIVDVDGDFDRARAVLRTIPAAHLYDDFTSEVVAEIYRMEGGRSVTSRLSRCSVNLETIFMALRKKEESDNVIYIINAVIQRIDRIVSNWRKQYEQGLRSL